MKLAMDIKERIKNSIPDKIYLKYRYKKVFGKKLNLNDPKTFNEKLQWLKLYDRKQIYTTMVDKYDGKKYAASLIGSQYIIPTLGVWDDFGSINFESLPNQFVLKTTHDSGGVVIVRDKEFFLNNKKQFSAAKEKLENSLKRNFYYVGREWPYKNVKPRIIAEQYMADNMNDYKLFCFKGNPRLTLVCSDRFTKDGLKEDFYDEVWNHLNVKRPEHGQSLFPIVRPKQYELMKELAIRLSSNTSFSRIDFYEIDEKIYFGEITLYPASGFEGFDPEEWDNKIGEWLKLPGGEREVNENNIKILLHIKSKVTNDENQELSDYKVMCFNGKPDNVMVCVDRGTGTTKYYFFDLNWKLMRVNGWGDKAPINFALPRPINLDEMVTIASKLSANIPLLRIDLYCINGNVYFGETTFFPDSGFDTNITHECDLDFGSKLHLPQ